MEISPGVETTITFGDLKDFRTVLLIVQQHHEARDISDSAASMLGEVRYRGITHEVNRILQRVEGLIGDLLMNSLDEDEEANVEDLLEEIKESPDEFEDELVDNPLGSRTIVPKGSTFFSEES